MKRTPKDVPQEVTKHPDGSETIRLKPGRMVFCDDCSEDYTDLPDMGGILVQSKGICPKCAPRWLRDLYKFGEEHFIRGRCPEGVSFADWLRGMR